MSTYILGVSAFYHDSAACLVKDGEIIAAAEEERFTRRKGEARFPKSAIEFCLSHAGIRPSQLHAVAYYDKPVMTFSRLLQTYLETPFRGHQSFLRSVPIWLNEKLKIPSLIDGALDGFDGEIYFSRHHESHAASSFFTSPFEDAAILIVDGVGEWASTSIGEGRGNTLRLIKEVRFPHSLGLLYTAFTQYLGFKVNCDEYKVMGLAPYGRPVFKDKILEHVVSLKDDGSIALNLDYFEFVKGLTMINDKLGGLLGKGVREPESELEQFHMDVASTIQHITDESMLRLAREARRVTGHNKICLAGGVALNCVANGLIYRENVFDDMYIQPAAGDAGGAIGAALQVWYQVMGNSRTVTESDTMKGAYLGPEINRADVHSYLDRLQIDYQVMGDRAALARQLAEWIAGGFVIGLCQGRMEFGPRALGSRSILGDPRDPETQSRINLKVKFRESFRPFAPAVLEERTREYFDIKIPSPYMLIVMPVKDEHCCNQSTNEAAAGLAKLKLVRSDVPAVTHVDYSVRLQTVTKERNGFFYDIIDQFYQLTGCPMIVNTSFNVRGEPIVMDHEHAYNCFTNTDIDILVIDDCVVSKPSVAERLGSRVLNPQLARDGV